MSKQSEKVQSQFKGSQLAPNERYCVAKMSSGGCQVRLYRDKQLVWQSGAAVQLVPYEQGWFYYVDGDGDIARIQRGGSHPPVHGRAPLPKCSPTSAATTRCSTSVCAPGASCKPATDRRLSVCFAIDSSVSMRSIAENARAAFDAQLTATTDAALSEGVDATISIVSFGSSIDDLALAVPARQRPQLASYAPDQNSTRVFDAVVRAAELCERAAHRDEAKLVLVITDGEDNASSRKREFAQLMQRIAADPSWTVTFMLPIGSKAAFCARHAVDPGNVSEWETGTAQGAATMAATQSTAVSAYVGSVARGVVGTKTFYASTDHIAARDLEGQADDVTAQARVWRVDKQEVIRPFIERKLRGGEIVRVGAAFYQLTEREEVQDHKQMLIRERSGARRIFGGLAVRRMLNLPTSGKIWVAPDAKSQYDVFVQSTSVNRKLVPGTDLVYWT